MKLKKAILEQLERDELKEICQTLEITDVDLRSVESMAAKVSRAHRAEPAFLFPFLDEGRVKAVAKRMGYSSTGRKGDLIERMLDEAFSDAQRRADVPRPHRRTSRRKTGRRAALKLEPTDDDGTPAKVGRGRKKTAKGESKVTRYTFDDVTDPLSPETGHTSLLPDEETVTLPMDNGWSKALKVGKLPADDRTVVVDMDPAADPVLFWSGKRNRRDVPVLPLQRNEIVSESRIAEIIERAQRNAGKSSGQASLFADLEKELRQADQKKRVEFYKHEENWKNKLICGDSLEVMESLMHYEGLRGKVQMIYIDPPYGIKYDSNFQQRVDSTKNIEKDAADDVLAIKAFRDTWTRGIHSYLSYLHDRLYLARELLTQSGSVFVQINQENLHWIMSLMAEVFGHDNQQSVISFFKTSGFSGSGLSSISDYLVWYAKDAHSVKYRQIYQNKVVEGDGSAYVFVELPDGMRRRLSTDERASITDLPSDWRIYRLSDLSAQGAAKEPQPFEFRGKTYYPSPNSHWKTRVEGLARLAHKNRIVASGKRLSYVRYANDFPVSPITNVWSDTVISGFADPKVYAVQTSPKVVRRCIAMTTDPGDIVFDPTAGGGTTAVCAEELGRRWVTCDSSRVAANVTRQRLLGSTFAHYGLRTSSVSGGFRYRTVSRVTLKSEAYNLEPEFVELTDEPEVDGSAVRVCGPFEVNTVGRYSAEDWRGQVVSTDPETGRAALANYIEVIAELYRKGASVDASMGMVHATADDGKRTIGISIGPITGRVSAKQITDAVQDALSAGILEVHVLGWAFEANVGEIKSQLERRGKVKIELVVIRPDTLAEGLKVTRPDQLFSPLALPEIKIQDKKGEYIVALEGVSIFDRKTRSTGYKSADSGYVSAWYLDQDYDGDCFVDGQMFFDFKKAPNLKAILKIDIDPEEFTLQLESQPFKAGEHKRIAVKVVDVYGNESTVVRDLT